ncbi:MAG: class I SAM-dependent methyltransferase [Actinobacteria bacterium]|nr:class I SAM-dependent methyltransferase [Actinomycetota bacterium]
MAAGGQVVPFEVDPERHAAALDYLERAGVADRVQLHLQDARDGLAALEGKFDFAFLDGVKAQYGDFDAVLPLLNRGAVLVVDNVLMNGRIAETAGGERIGTARAFNERLLTHPELTSTLTPVGDGVLVAVRQ